MTFAIVSQENQPRNQQSSRKFHKSPQFRPVFVPDTDWKGKSSTYPLLVAKSHTVIVKVLMHQPLFQLKNGTITIVNNDSYYMDNSMSWKEEAGKMLLSCPLGTIHRVPQAKFSREPYNNKSFTSRIYVAVIWRGVKRFPTKGQRKAGAELTTIQKFQLELISLTYHSHYNEWRPLCSLFEPCRRRGHFHRNLGR